MGGPGVAVSRRDARIACPGGRRACVWHPVMPRKALSHRITSPWHTFCSAPYHVPDGR